MCNWWIDQFADDYTDSNTLALGAIQRLQDEDRSGVCEDDVEATCPYVGVLPDESPGEHASPLHFPSSYNRPAAQVIPDDPRFLPTLR